MFSLENSWAQISPPGMAPAQTADWFAFGVRQELDTIKAWQSMSYVGIGNKSNPDNLNPFTKPSILVFNQEFYHQFHKHWQYSIALSYRRQNEYTDNAPFENSTPSIKQEFRVYSRLSYVLKTSRIKFAPTLRQEFRKFYSPHFKTMSEDFAFRTRFRLQLSINLDAKKTHRLISSSEQLFSISKESTPNQWSGFNYSSSRFLLYYSLSPQKSPFIFSVGYMNELIGSQSPTAVHYLAFDIIIENPFNLKMRKRIKESIIENFE